MVVCGGVWWFMVVCGGDVQASTGGVCWSSWLRAIVW